MTDLLGYNLLFYAKDWWPFLLMAAIGGCHPVKVTQNLYMKGGESNFPFLWVFRGKDSINDFFLMLTPALPCVNTQCKNASCIQIPTAIFVQLFCLNVDIISSTSMLCQRESSGGILNQKKYYI